MRILYFAYLRDRAGTGEEDVSPPSSVKNVGDLVGWLASSGEARARVFSDMSIVRIAVNQEYATLDHPLSAGDEIAFFPPVTGGLSS